MAWNIDLHRISTDETIGAYLIGILVEKEHIIVKANF